MDNISNCSIYIIIQLFMLFQILYYKAFIYLQVFQKILITLVITSDHQSATEKSSTDDKHGSQRVNYLDVN